MHGILTLHDLIRTGELMKRAGRAGGAGIQVEQLDGTPSHVQPTVSRPHRPSS